MPPPCSGRGSRGAAARRPSQRPVERGGGRRRGGLRRGHDRGDDSADLSLLALRPARAARAARVPRGPRRRGGRTVAVGPHGSATPRPTLDKLGVDVVVRGECEEIVLRLAAAADLRGVPAIAFRENGSDRRHRRPAFQPVHRPARAALAGRMARPPHPPSPSLRPRTGRSGRRGRGFARLPLQLLVLRQDRLSRQIPPARHRAGGRRDRRPDRAAA